MMSFPEFEIAWGGHMKRAPVDFPVLDLPMSKSRFITELEGISSGGLILSLDPYVCPFLEMPGKRRIYNIIYTYIFYIYLFTITHRAYTHVLTINLTKLPRFSTATVLV
jgi:hypothetical protein